MSSRKLRQKTRICYYEPEEPGLDEYLFCERCSDYVFEYCAIHGPLLVIPDDKVPSKPNFPSFVPRAALTIPHVFLHLARSIIPGAGIGVFSTLTLPRGVRFGPYRGLRTDSIDSMYCWQVRALLMKNPLRLNIMTKSCICIYIATSFTAPQTAIVRMYFINYFIYDRNNKRSHVVDAADGDRSNWMRYVNCSRHWSEQNLVAYQYKGQLYYRTIKIIPRFTELLVFYGSEFANILGVNLGAYNAPKGYASKFGAPVPKKTIPAVQPTIASNSFNKCGKSVKEIEEPKTFTTITLEEKPGVDNIIQTHDEVNNNLNEKNCIIEINKCNDAEKDKSRSEITADVNINSAFIKPYNKVDYDLNKSNNVIGISHHLHTEKELSRSLTKLYSCDICKKSFNSKYYLVSHINTHTGEKPYQCTVCKKSFRQKIHLNNHILTHTGEKLYQCNVCKKSFSRKNNLTDHIRTHTGEKPYQCNVCKKCFSLKNNLTDHIRTHTGEKPYQCNVCKKCFSLKNNLTDHIRTHTGEKPYQCNVCKKCFSQKSSLNQHMRMHTGEKPYQCNVCKKCFRRKITLNDHIHTHTGEKPYQCNICKKSFRQKNHLNNHIRTHTGEKPYQCNVCEKCFRHKITLNDHIQTHTGEKPYQCNVCKKCFNHKSNLNRHIRIHTKIL